MITTRESGQIDLEFGAGDILVGSTTLLSGEGLILLSNQPPHSINSSSTKFAGCTNFFDHEDVQAIMTFSKTESIDVMIEALENAKILMKLRMKLKEDK